MSYKKEYAWINKKYKQGVSKAELRDSVGIFSNREKKKVMQEKKLTSKQYEQRKSFLFNVYSILTGSVKKSRQKKTIKTKKKNMVQKSKYKYDSEGYIIIDDAYKYPKEELRKMWAHNDALDKARGVGVFAPDFNKFQYDEKGRIKGHYTVDGFFEPD